MDNAAILRDLAMAKATFQLRAIEAVLRGPDAPPAMQHRPGADDRQRENSNHGEVE
jgi:hypothetical protein